MQSQDHLFISHGILPESNRRSCILKSSGRSAYIPFKDRILVTKQIYTESSSITPNKRSLTPMTLRTQSPKHREEAKKVRSKSRIHKVDVTEMTELEKLYLPTKLNLRKFMWSPDMMTYGFEGPKNAKKLIENWRNKYIQQESGNIHQGGLYIMPDLAKEIMDSQKMKM